MGKKKNYRSKKRKFVGNRYISARAEQTISSDASVDIITASSSKLDSNKSVQAENILKFDELYGNRIMSIEILLSVFAILCCPSCMEKELSLTEDSRFGMCSNFLLKCRNCCFSHGFASSRKVNNKNEINLLVVYALRLIGKGYSAGKKLISMLNMPFLSKATYRRLELNLVQAASKSAIKSMCDAAKQIRNTKSGIVNCGVSMDGTWQKRGYSSLNGLVSCISIDTGKVLDIEAMSQFCRICKSLFRTQIVTEEPHACRNHTGSAASMETVGAYRIFERSKTARKLCYTEYYGDGDSKAYDAVKNIYGENSVEKLECIGHIQKRVGTRLRKLKKSTKGISGRGKLTDRFIDKLQNYYGIAIRNNKGNLEDMQRAVIAVLYHCCSSIKYPMHGQCPTGVDSWCKFQRSIVSKTPFKEKSTGLPQHIINIIKPVYKKLCDQKLLSKCLHGKTQNANESFNGLLWNFVPKQHFVELQTLQLGSFLSVLQFNDGKNGILSVLNCLNLRIGSHMMNGLMLIEKERIHDSKRHSLPNAKTRRKKLSAQRKKKCLQIESKEGVTYHPGEF